MLLLHRADTVLGMATHRILHKVEPGKLKMELTDKKGSNTGEIQFILQASGGRFAQQSGASTGSGSGVGSGAGTGAGAGAASLGAGDISLLMMCCELHHRNDGIECVLKVQELAPGEMWSQTSRGTPTMKVQLPLVLGQEPLVPLALV